MMKYGLSDRQLDEIISMIREHEEVEEAILFGSRAMGTFKRASDVDIALKGDRVTNGLAAALQADFEEDTSLPFFFDIAAYPAIRNKAFLEHIDSKGITLFRDNPGVIP